MMKRCLLFGLLIVSTFPVGCGRQEERSPESPTIPRGAAAVAVLRDEPRSVGQVSVSLLPSAPTVKDALQAVVSGGSDTMLFYWERNGELLPGQTDSRIAPYRFLKGDTVSVVVETANTQTRASATIVNSLPHVISVPFADPHVRRGVDILAEPEGVDADGDPLDYRYRWTINDEEIFGNDGPRLPGDLFRKGDRIGLAVTPSDGEEPGEPFVGAEFIVPNAPPVFITTPPIDFSGHQYVYAAQAEDPDVDPLTFFLDVAPPGMTIDGQTGELTWAFTRGQGGEHPIRIVAQDDEGMKAIQEYTLNLAIPERGGI